MPGLAVGPQLSFLLELCYLAELLNLGAASAHWTLLSFNLLSLDLLHLDLPFLLMGYYLMVLLT